MSKPFIALSGRRWQGRQVNGLPSNFADAHVDLHIADYARCIDAAGGVPVMIPFEADPDAVMGRFDALVLTGGADVDPACYGGPADERIGATEPARDAYELALFRAAQRLGRPVLAVCRGMQLVNVALGGTLLAHIPDEQGHAAWDRPRSDLAHTVHAEPDSWLAAAYGTTDVAVNTLHHQSVDRPGGGVRVTARAADGVIEAFQVDEPSGTRVFAVQWHPELVVAQPDPSFVWLVDAASR
jgi:putative glutamine amidotransferase